MADRAGGTRFRNFFIRLRFSPVTQETVKIGVTLKKRIYIDLLLVVQPFSQAIQGHCTFGVMYGAIIK